MSHTATNLILQQRATFDGQTFTRASYRPYSHAVIVATELMDARKQIILAATADAHEVAQSAAAAAGGTVAYVKERLALFDEALTRARVSTDGAHFYTLAGWCTLLEQAVAIARRHAQSHIVEVVFAPAEPAVSA